MGKAHRLPFVSVELYSTPFFLIHSDVWQSPVISNLGFHYYVTFVDDCSRFTWLYPLRQSEVYDCFCAFQALVERLFDRKIRSEERQAYLIISRHVVFHVVSIGCVSLS